MAEICVLGSGSRGNSVYIGAGRAKILIDAGLSTRQTKLRLEQIGVDIEEINAVLISHEHSDHTAGIKMADKLKNLVVYFNRRTAEEVQARNGCLPEHIKIFSSGESFQIEDIHINPFSVLHDAVEPVGFEIRFDGVKICLATDLGYVTRLVKERIKESDYLILESNHDEEMLRNDNRRPWALKQRIMAKTGHLSNKSAGECITEALSDRLKMVFLAHLSSDCNKPELAIETVRGRLAKAGVNNLDLEITHQQQISRLIKL